MKEVVFEAEPVDSGLGRSKNEGPQFTKNIGLYVICCELFPH